MTLSIYGPTVTRDDAAQWLRNNPRASQDRNLLRVADYSGNGGVDATELSKACNVGTVVLDGVHTFKLVDDEPAPAPAPRHAVRGEVRDSQKPFPKAAVMMGSFFAGMGIIAMAPKAKTPALALVGFGVLCTGMIWAASHK